MPNIHHIIFSCDRPFQLQQLLRTKNQFLIFEKEPQTFILYKTSNIEFEKRYEILIKEFPNYVFIKEVNFALQLEKIINLSEEFILFNVDDAIFYRTYYINNSINVLNENPNIIGFSLRLNENITRCHPANAESSQPEFNRDDNGNLIFELSKGQVDWDYPLEISSSIYRKETIIDAIIWIKERIGIDGLSHPNKFESNLFNYYLINYKLHDKSLACFAKSICSIVTVNRSQNIFPNPIYSEISLNSMNYYLDNNIKYDTDMYRNQKFNSIHIGDMYIS